MKYFDNLVSELLQYKKQSDISLVNLLNFTYDVIYAEKKVRPEIIKEVDFIKDNTHEKINTALSIFEFIYNKNKSVSTTSKPIFIKTNKGWRSFYYSQFLKIWQETFFNISKVQTKILKDYNFSVKYSQDSDKIKGLEELD